MCELLIRVKSKTHKDPDKDRRGSWKEGMVIVIKDDGWKWSHTEQGPAYKILKVPGVDVDDVAKWAEPAFDLDDPTYETIYRTRRFVIDMTKLTAAVEANLENALTPSATRVAALNLITEDQKKP